LSDSSIQRKNVRDAAPVLILTIAAFNAATSNTIDRKENRLELYNDRMQITRLCTRPMDCLEFDRNSRHRRITIRNSVAFVCHKKLNLKSLNSFQLTNFVKEGFLGKCVNSKLESGAEPNV